MLVCGSTLLSVDLGVDEAEIMLRTFRGAHYFVSELFFFFFVPPAARIRERGLMEVAVTAISTGSEACCRAGRHSALANGGRHPSTTTGGKEWE